MGEQRPPRGARTRGGPGRGGAGGRAALQTPPELPVCVQLQGRTAWDPASPAASPASQARAGRAGPCTQETGMCREGGGLPTQVPLRPVQGTGGHISWLGRDEQEVACTCEPPRGSAAAGQGDDAGLRRVTGNQQSVRRDPRLGSGPRAHAGGSGDLWPAKSSGFHPPTRPRCLRNRGTWGGALWPPEKAAGRNPSSPVTAEGRAGASPSHTRHDDPSSPHQASPRP